MGVIVLNASERCNGEALLIASATGLLQEIDNNNEEES
jgi:hypothetical protein